MFFDESRLERALERMPPRHRLAFASACAERLIPDERASATPHGPPLTEARRILFRLWDEFQGEDLAPREVAALESACVRLVSAVAPTAASIHQIADLTLVAVRHCVRCRQTGTAADAIAAARCIYKALAQVAARQMNIPPGGDDREPRVIEHALVQAELARQQRDLAELAVGPVATLAVRAWRRARRERPAVLDATAAEAWMKQTAARAVKERRTLLPRGGAGPVVIVWRRPAPSPSSGDLPAGRSDPAEDAPLLPSPRPAAEGGPAGGACPPESATSGSAASPTPPRGGEPPASESKPTRSPPRRRGPARKKGDRTPRPAFIRACDPSMSVRAVVALARSRGIDLDESYVRAVRQRMHHEKVEKTIKVRRRAAKPSAPSGRPGPSNAVKFILAHPELTPAALVKEAQRAQVLLTKGYVLQVREAEHRGVPMLRWRPPKRGLVNFAPSVAANGSTPPPERVPPPPDTQPVLRTDGCELAVADTRTFSTSASETMLLAAVAELGLERAFAILEAQRRRVRAMISPRDREHYG